MRKRRAGPVAVIRSILHMLWMALTVIPWGTFVIIASLFVGSTRMYWMCAGWLRLAVNSGCVILGIKNRVTGWENLPQGENDAAVLLVKHQSTWETLVMPAIMPHPLAYVFKKELLYIPFFGWSMARMDMIHIDRSEGTRAFHTVVKQGKRLMQQGTWVIMFPEGTRIPRGEAGNYKSGGTRLAIKCGVPVIPIAVTSAKCWPRKAFVKTPGIVDISIGKPIPSVGRKPDELMREVQNWIEAEMRRLDPEAYGGSPPAMMRALLQFTLDLFDPPPPEAPDSSSKEPLALSEYKKSAIELEASGTPAETASGPILPLAPAAFRHPRANREARLGGALVAYEFRRGKRRSIGFSVGAEGLVVSAPRWVPLAEVEAALAEKSAWVLKKLEQTRQLQQRLEANRIEWRDGAVLPFLGSNVVVVLDPRHAFQGAGAVLDADAGNGMATLRIGLPSGATPAQIRDAVQAWLMREARRLFTERLNYFAPLLGVQWRRLALSSAGTRWGSAGADGSIRLNWRLVHFRLPVIDYVVAHELSHLRVMNHSPLFWDTVRTVVPDYAELRGQLRDEALPHWD